MKNRMITCINHLISSHFIKCLCLVSLFLVNCKSNRTIHDFSKGSFGFSVQERDRIESDSVEENRKDRMVISKSAFTSWKATGILSGKGGTFLIQPGDYRSWGRLDIRKGGTANKPLIIIGIENPKIHPVGLNLSEQVLIQGLSIRGTYSHPPGHKARKIVDVEHVIVSGLTISGNNDQLASNEHKKSPDYKKVGGKSNRITFVNHITIKRCVFENVVSKNAIKIHGKNVKIDKCVVRNCYRVPKGDNIGISIRSNKIYQSSNIDISNNEIYNCTDGVQIVNMKEKVDNTTPNVSILNNDIYITDDYKFSKNGKELAGSENGIDLKTGGTEAQPVIVKGNFLRGFRQTDPSVGGSGGSGAAINLTVNANHIEVSDNIISDAPIGIVVASVNRKIIADNRAHISIKNNLIYDLYTSDKIDGIGIKGDIGVTISNNTISNAKTFLWSGHSSPHTIQNNIVINDFGNRKWSKYHKAQSTDNIWINPRGAIYSGNKRKEQKLQTDNFQTYFEAFETTISPYTNPTTVIIPYGKFKGGE